MQLLINGESKAFAPATLNVAELLKLEAVEMPEMVSVQHNGEFLRPENYATVALADGDAVDFLYFMGGGQ
ncbi:MAG: sulfur carrier protein ThiS [Zoogloeaceae bacterium]|jgi:sulfur carrier protein|nr:sulfur carrier protein ThiS [Zoogloeaceae bacterium]